MATQAEVIRPDQNKRRERLFYPGMVVAIVITVFAGFSRTFYLRPYFQTQALIPLLVLHGVVFSSWMVLMIVIGTVTALVRAKGPSPVPGVNPLSFLTIPLGDMLVFAILVGAAFYFRRRADVHKRLMLLATIGILPAAVGRLPLAFIQQYGPLAFFGLSDLFVVPCLVYDFVTRGRPHRATVLGAALIVISHPLRPIIGGTHAWLAFAT